MEKQHHEDPAGVPPVCYHGVHPVQQPLTSETCDPVILQFVPLLFDL